MKGTQLVFLVLAAAAVIVSGFPREREVESIDDDVEEVPVPVPTDPAFGYVPSYFSFFPDFDLVSRIKGLMTRLRTQIGDSFGGIDWSKGNTTSTTKVIDGHVVTVNETSYKDDDSDLVLHVKVIDVKPTEGAEAEDTENAKNNEDAESNEIPNKQEEDVAESLEYKNQPEEMREHLVETRDYLYDDRSVEEVDNDIEGSKPIRLDNDTRVNWIGKDKGEMVMLPDDVEYFVPDNRDMYIVNNNNEYVYVPKNMPIYAPVPYERFQHSPRSEKLTSLT